MRKKIFYIFFGLIFLSCYEINPNALLIIENLFMTTITKCSIQTGGVAAQYIKPIGLLDLAITNSYFMFPRVSNLLIPIHEAKGKGVQEEPLTETNYIQIIGAKVRYEIGDLEAFIPADKVDAFFKREQFVLTSGVIKPGESSLLQIKIIPGYVGNELQKAFAQFVSKNLYSYPGKEIIVYITLEGVLQDQSSVYSNEFVFPIQLCWGCLVRYTGSTKEDCQEMPKGALFPCLPGQDEGMDCQVCNMVAMWKDICYPPEKK